MTTIADFVTQLSLHEVNKPICFCQSPMGLQFYRFKRRGPMRLQMEFRESLERKEGKLTVETVPHREGAPKDVSATVRSFIRHLDASTDSRCELVFGTDFVSLQFVGVETFGDWVSVEFTKRIYRNAVGKMMVDETVESGERI